MLTVLSCVVAFPITTLPAKTTTSLTKKKTTVRMVSELHIPGYVESKKTFLLREEDLLIRPGGQVGQMGRCGVAKQATLQPKVFAKPDFESLIPHKDGHLVHKTQQAVLSSSECRAIVQEAEETATRMGWTTNRHGNFPTTDIPLAELPNTLRFLRLALEERIYPMLAEQFKEFLPDPSKLRVADGFVVKYDAEGGQTELKPHRDGSVLSFNIALNPASEFEGGGTWFASLDRAVRIDEGEIVSHASGLLHGGHGISSGRRYILVGFVILEGYDSWSMRFYNDVRNL